MHIWGFATTCAALALAGAGTSVFAQGSRLIDFTVNGYSGPALTNFPVLVRLSAGHPSGFSYADCQADGTDLAFRLADGTALSREIDTWDPDGTSLVWVRLPTMQQGTSFQGVYKNPALTSQPASQTDGSTWTPGGYVAVWHMAETIGAAHDSTGHGLDAVPTPATATATNNLSVVTDGPVGSARGRTSTVGCALIAPSYDSFALGSSFTVSGWWQESVHSAGTFPIARKNVSSEAGGWKVETTSKGLQIDGEKSTTTLTIPMGSYVGIWQNIAFSFDNAFVSGYSNGVCTTSGTIVAATDNGRGLAIAATPSYGSLFRGYYDEIRLRDRPSTAAWIETEHRVVTNLSFLSASPAVTNEGTLTVVSDGAWFGTPFPPYGVTEGIGVNSNFTCTADEVYLYESGDTRAVCKGWTLYSAEGEKLGEGDAPSFSYTHTCAATLTWKFAIEHKVAVETVKCSVNTNALWFAQDAVFSATATPDAGYWLHHWSGDAPEAQVFGTTVSFTVERPAFLLAAAVTTASNDLYVSPDGDDANDGLTWATAFKSIPAALVVAQSNDTVVVTNGVYSAPAADQCCAVLNKAVTLRSVNGPDYTMITNAFGTSCATTMVYVAAAKAVFSGFSVVGARRIAIDLLDYGEVTNCVVRDADTDTNLGYGTGNGVLMRGLVSIRGNGGAARDCRFVNNRLKSGAPAQVGVVYFLPNGVNYSVGWMTGCIITNNFISGGGSGCENAVVKAGPEGGKDVSGKLRNCLIAGNVCTWGAAMKQAYQGYLYADNCTIANNRNTGYSGGYCVAGYMSMGRGAQFNNCLFYNNRNPVGVTDVDRLDGWTHYNCRFGNPTTTSYNCTNAPPSFVDEAVGDYRLRTCALVDAGNKSLVSWATAEGATDLAGEVRVTGDEIDIGCYEYRPGPLDCSFDTPSATVVAPAALMIPASVAGTNTTSLHYKWEVTETTGTLQDDGYPAEPVLLEGDGDGYAALEHTFGPGIYTVKLTVTNSVGETSFNEVAGAVNVLPQTIHVSSAGTETFPYATPETGFATISAAVTAAVAGQTVMVAPHDYDEKVYLGKAITLESSGGADVTSFRPTATVTYTLEIQNPGAVVRGFTVHGTSNKTTSDIYIAQGGLVEDCVIYDPPSSLGNGLGRAVIIKNGTLRRSVIRNIKISNSASWAEAYCPIYVESGLIDSCFITNNTLRIVDISLNAAKCLYGLIGLWNSSAGIRNTLIAGNSVTNLNYLVRCKGGTVESCTFADNRLAGNPVGPALGLDSGSRLVNTIVARNHIAGVESNLTVAAGIAYSNNYVNVSGAIPGVGNIVGSTPGFRNVPFDYTLKPSSPCAGHGTALLWMRDAEGNPVPDLAGQPRIVGAKPDMGCYECQQGTGMMLLIQ